MLLELPEMPASLYARNAFFIGGSWAAPTSEAIFEVVSPVSEQVIGRAPAGANADIDRAVAAARLAFDEGPWPRMSAAERAAILRRMAAFLDENGERIALLVSDEVGSPLAPLRRGKAVPGYMFRSMARLLDEHAFVRARPGGLGGALIRHEPLGVVAAIAPWNGPFHIMCQKIAPALAAGCTIIAKPAQETPLSVYLLAEAAEAAGLPPGVLNIVPADRATSEYLVTRKGVDKVSFTGSTVAGQRIGALCAHDFRRVALELGGKSAAIILDDADAQAAAAEIISRGIAYNSGQACVALSRILVPASRASFYSDALAAEVEKLVVGPPRAPATRIGPMVSHRQQQRVAGYIQTGLAEGAQRLTGATRQPGLERGWFVMPTLFGKGDNAMRIAQEEIFGPVAVIIPYRTESEAVAIANDTAYGLGGAVFSADTRHAYEIAKRVRAGTVGVNQYYTHFDFPFGGFKASGVGREGGLEGLLAFTDIKTVTGLATEP